jgi:serine protease Do
MTKSWRSWWSKFRWWAVLAALAAAPFSAGSPRLSAADANMPTTGVDTNKERLARLLEGASPTTVDDLKLMQQQVQQLTEKLIACTVGVQVGHAWGSGVIISKDGYVLTAAHVAGQPGREVRFMLSDGRTVKGKSLGLFRTMDAGLMKITDDGEYPSAQMGASDAIREGFWCLATGHPGGYQDDRKPVLRLGRVLVMSRDAITTDCTLVGGDSGGPLFDLQGNVIGINSRIGAKITANMHVPVNTYRDHWDRMVKAEAWGHLDGHAPYIGLRGEEDQSQARIASVVPDSPAEKAGIKPGDVILNFNGRQVVDFRSFKDFIGEHQPGDKVQVQVRRGEETKDFEVKLARQGR